MSGTLSDSMCHILVDAEMLSSTIYHLALTIGENLFT
jgi:hypothetical protein